RRGGMGAAVDRALSAESAADRGRDHLHARDRNVQDLVDRRPRRERSLRARPDRELPVGVPLRGRGVRLDVTLVHGRAAVPALEYALGLAEARLDVPLLEPLMRRDVAGRRALAAQLV